MKLKHVDVVILIFLIIPTVSFGVLMVQPVNSQELITYLKLPPYSSPMGILPVADGVIVAFIRVKV